MTRLIELRIIANNESIKSDVQEIINALLLQKYEILKTSKPYPRRPPDDSNSTVYLTLSPPD